VRLDADLWARDLLKDNCDPYYRERYAEIPARIGRDGLYWDRRSNTSWVELSGRAFVMDAQQTRYEFEYQDVMRFNAHQTAALREMVVQRMATPAQRELYRRIADYQRERITYRRLFARGVMARRRLAARLAAQRVGGAGPTAAPAAHDQRCGAPLPRGEDGAETRQPVLHPAHPAAPPPPHPSR